MPRSSHRTPGSPSRRDFLKTSAVVGAGYFIAPRPSWAASRLANGQINVASIGVGGKGNSDSGQAGKHGKMVALCDIDDNELNSKASSFPDAKKYNDFREMLDEMGDKIDAVTVSTPDHMHAPASIMAMKMGKHVYCQKPLTHSVYEARMMREVAADKKVATQMGNQGTAEDGLRRAVEVIQAGAIGPVREVHVWTNRPIWPQAPDVMSRPVDTPGCPSTSTGTCCWASRPSGPTPYTRPMARANASAPITPSTGAAGGTLAPAPWATWPATPPTWPSWR